MRRYAIEGPRIGQYAQTERCEACDGSGRQLEFIWRGGMEEDEREVRCAGCAGRGSAVELVCGRCGEVSAADPGEPIAWERSCTGCGHEAPNALWLPMTAIEDREEYAG